MNKGRKEKETRRKTSCRDNKENKENKEKNVKSCRENKENKENKEKNDKNCREKKDKNLSHLSWRVQTLDDGVKEEGLERES